jgi:flagellar motor protein MotB
VAGGRVDAVGKGATELMNPRVPTAAENRRVTIVAQPGS